MQIGFLPLSVFPFHVAHGGCSGKTQVIHRVIPQQLSCSLLRGDLGVGKGQDETELTEFLANMNGI